MGLVSLKLWVVSAWGIFAMLFAWFLMAWPLWDRVIVEHGCNAISLLPFLVSLIGLLPPSVENLTQNRLGEILLTLSSALLSIASSVAMDELTYANGAVIAALTFVLLQSNLYSPSLRKFTHTTDRGILIRIVLVVGAAMGLLWAIYLSGILNGELLLVQFLAFSTICAGCAAALTSAESHNDLGIGSFFFWLGLRFLSSPGIRMFYLWGIYCGFAFVALNIANPRGNIGGLVRLRGNFVALGCSLSPWILSISAVALIVSSSGSLMHISGYWKRVPLFGNLTTMETYYFSSLEPVGFYERTRYIYENPGCLTNGMLLLGNACFLYINEAHKREVSGRMWQALFFLLVALSVVYYGRDRREFILYLVGSPVPMWSQDTTVVFGLCAIGALLCLAPLHRHKRESFNTSVVPLFLGSCTLGILFITRLLPVWPEHLMEMQLPPVVRTESNYTAIVGMPNHWNYTKSVAEVSDSIQFNLSDMLHDEVIAMLALSFATFFLLIAGMWDRGLSDIGLLINLAAALLFGTALVRLYSEVQELRISGSLYDPFVSSVGITMMITLVSGAVARIKYATDKSWMEIPADQKGWPSEEEFIQDWQTSGSAFADLIEFVRERTAIDIGTTGAVGDPASAYYLWLTIDRERRGCPPCETGAIPL